MSLAADPNPQAQVVQESTRPVLRKDLDWIPYAKNHRWVLHDPISNAFFYFNDLERRAAQLLDGSRSMTQVAEMLVGVPTSKSLQLPWVESLANRLNASGLLMPSGRTRHAASRPSGWKRIALQILANPLAIRIPVIRPSGYFRLAQAIAAILFHPLIALVGCVAMAIVSFLLLAQWLNQPERIFFDITRIQGDRWLALLVMLMAIKSLHELGHYLACARWRVDCQELGFMILCFSPCFYCDTTDAWKLKSRWSRAAISAAGIYVEMWLAILGGLVYLNSDDELARTMGAGAWMTCTVGTLLLNGNPCFRYDGYYILSDLWGVPNLGSQSQQSLWQTLIGLLGGRWPENKTFDKPVWQLVLFAVVSGIYRCVVIIFLVWLIWSLLVPSGFGIFALMIIGSLATGLVFAQVRFAQGLVVEAFAPRPIRLLRVAALFSALGGLVWFALTVPIPNVVQSRGFMEPKTRQPLFIPDNALLTKISVQPGRHEPQTVVLVADSFEKRQEWLRLGHQLAETQSRIELLEKARVNSEEAAFELPTLREMCEKLESKFAIKQKEIESLTIETREEGILYGVSIPLMMPFKLGEPVWVRDQIFDWMPLGASLERGTIVGWISKQDRFTFQVAVSEADVRWLRVGSSAEAILDSRSHVRYPCTVTRIAPEPLLEFPQQLIGDPSLSGIRDERGKLRFERPHYLVVVEPLEALNSASIGASATIHFDLPGKTIFEYASDKVRQSLRLE